LKRDEIAGLQLVNAVFSPVIGNQSPVDIIDQHLPASVIGPHTNLTSGRVDLGYLSPDFTGPQSRIRS
jgi:hypothetical protein